ncbi:EamA family transporter [Pseudooceanicola sp.]|uniref:EamA family transporter n=1 Tax=Pseudooceanicola sp. TaxID=1914328 RepID=UPI00405A2D76
MSEWIISIEGTETGHTVALCLALLAALLHALFGSLQKGRVDPWISRGAIDASQFLLALPIALFLVPPPVGIEWVLIFGALPIHFAYKVGMAQAYSLGAYTVVYPVVRGTGPVVTVIAAWIVFGEVFTLTQWLGVFVLLAGIFGLAIHNLRTIKVARDTLVPAMWLAVVTGALAALYTTYDAYAIRATPDPFTFLAWFFVIASVDMPILAAIRWRRMTDRPDLGHTMRLGVFGAILAFGSFGSVMLATRLDKVGEAAILRETSTVFAALIGWLVLRETVGPTRVALMSLIALGAVIVELAG